MTKNMEKPSESLHRTCRSDRDPVLMKIHYTTLHLGLGCFKHVKLCRFCVMLAPQRVAGNYISRIF